MKSHSFHFFYIIILFCFFSFFVTKSFSGSLEYTVTLQNMNGSPNTTIPLVLVESSTFEIIKIPTNHFGIYHIKLTHGKEWIMHVGEMRNHTYFELTRGITRGRETIIYDVEKWKRITKKPVNREKLNLTEISQNCKTNEYGNGNYAVVVVNVSNYEGKSWSKMNVNMVSYADKKIYKSTTNYRGDACFKVPLNTNYYIDVDEEIEYDYFEVTEFQKSRLELKFEKIKFSEKIDSKGNIIQYFEEEPQATSSRILTKIRVKKDSKSEIGEMVYLESSYRRTIYAAKTDKDGVATFLLPKKTPYIVHFEFQKNADVLDLSRMRGIGHFNSTVTYNPDPKLEHPENFLPSKSYVRNYDINHRLIKNYSEPEEEELVKVQAIWGNAKINGNSREAILELGISAKAPKLIKANKKRKNISLVLDKSGSMSGPNFDAMISSVKKLIEQLNPED